MKTAFGNSRRYQYPGLSETAFSYFSGIRFRFFRSGGAVIQLRIYFFHAIEEFLVIEGRSNLLVDIAELGGRKAGRLAECAREGRTAGESRAQRDFRDGKAPVAKQLLCIRKTQFGHVLIERHSRELLENPLEVIFAESLMLGDTFQGNRLLEMNGYIFACSLHRTLVARGGGMDVGIRISVLTAALYRYQREYVEQKSVDLRLGHERESGPLHRL